MRDYKYWLRWLAVIPGALGASILAYWSVSFALSTSLGGAYPSTTELYGELAVLLLLTFIANCSFIWYGSRIAPSHKLATSIVLFGFQMFMVGGFVFLRLFGQHWMGLTLNCVAGCIGAMLPIAGALAGLYLTVRRASAQDVLDWLRITSMKVQVNNDGMKSE